MTVLISNAVPNALGVPVLKFRLPCQPRWPVLETSFEG